MEHRLNYQDTSSTVKLAKQSCNISKTNSEMTDDEISAVCRWIGEQAPDTIWADGKPVFGKMGISAMLFIAISEFPEFYEEHGLSQFN